MGFSVDDVIQHAAYDPQARHERYIRNRQLKGRQAAPRRAMAGIGSRVVDANAPQSGRFRASQSAIAAKSAAARQAASNARQIAQIKGRLSDLKQHLDELLAKQKASSSSSSKSSTSSKSQDTKTANSQPKTAAQKAAAKESLKKAQQARAKDQKATPDKKDTKTAPTLEAQIAHTRAVIADVETKLRAAIEQARTQTASNGR